MKKTMANVWGHQTEVNLGTWEEIKTSGFKKNDRAFGTLNDNMPALYFGRRNSNGDYEWYLTTEKLEDIHD
jgi:hypothetical protein